MTAYWQTFLLGLAYVLPMVFLLLVVVLPLTNAALVWGISKRYLGIPTSLSDCYGRAIRRLIPLVWPSFLFCLVVMLGSAFCLIPGIIFYVWFFFCTNVVIIEPMSGTRAMGRSKTLTKGSFLLIIVVLFILFIISVAINSMANILGQTIIQPIVAALLGSALIVFTTAVSVVLYYSCRCKVEGFDLAMLAESVSQGDAPSDLDSLS